MLKYQSSLKRAVLPLLLSLLSACDSGSSNQPTVSQPTPPSPSTGVFRDTVVAGLNYQTATQRGITNNLGEFSFLPKEEVEFFLGDIPFGSTTGKSVITPADISRLGNENYSSPGVINRVRLLLSINTFSSDAQIKLPTTFRGLAGKSLIFAKMTVNV